MAEANREQQLHHSPTVRGLYVLAGWIFVGLAVLGAVLPVFPTTIFLILAAASFARGSERFYGWLLENRSFGPLIRDWRERRTIPRRAKVRALILIVLSFTVTIGFFVGAWWLRALLALTGTALFTFLVRLPESEGLAGTNPAPAPVPEPVPKAGPEAKAGPAPEAGPVPEAGPEAQVKTKASVTSITPAHADERSVRTG